VLADGRLSRLGRAHPRGLAPRRPRFAAGYAIAINRPRDRRSRAHRITGRDADSRSRRSPPACSRMWGRVRLADPRPGGALLLLGPHGAAHHLGDHRRAPCCSWVRPPWARAPGCLFAAMVAPDRCGYLSRLIPATLLFNFVINRHAHPGGRRRVAAQTGCLHFGLHALILVSSLIVLDCPLLEPAGPRFPPAGRPLARDAWFLFLPVGGPDRCPASFPSPSVDHPALTSSTRRSRALWGISALSTTCASPGSS